MPGEDLVAEVAKSRRAGLIAIRNQLAETLSDRGHSLGCTCECSVAGDGRVVAAVAKQLAAIIAELDALPGVVDGEASAVVSLSARIADKRAALGNGAAAAV